MMAERSPARVLQRRPFGSWLLGPADQSPRMLRIRVQTLLTVLLVGANLTGAAVAFVLAVFVLPGPETEGQLIRVLITVGYLTAALIIGSIWCTKRALRATRWAQENRPATRQDQITTLRLPLQLTMIVAFFWLLATVCFTVVAIILEPASVVRVLVTTFDGGIVTCAATYLLAEFSLRPIAARALVDSPPPRRLLAAGLKERTIFFWAAGSGVPVAGLMLAALLSLIDKDVSATRLAVIMLSLGGVVLIFGCLLTVLSAKSVVVPVRSVRTALAVIASGDLNVRIPVFDGTELGSLQAGFNQMAAGLREREHIRDVFGRYVGPEVVRDALTRHNLGGAERFAAVLFVDLVGSTGLAATRPPVEVVALLNRFFAIVVDEVDRHGGFVNKFAGDAALVVFGAPTELEDAAGNGLAAARALAHRLADELPEATAGIGVTAGVVVAGTVGDERRHEYTVIGDPVNEAARLTELAKSVPGRLVASMTAVDHAGPDEAAHWQPHGELTVRGRTTPTHLAIPTP
ncbi:adenylate/guanylate cyclase domain-containing protein [Kribbella deserti]|uniref:Adenylate/guanylate cyclase domain-containing protein n=1 Tax=Kribbella deserti TaxID=1926257 RepID=A0ABV6QPL1_9ACTN